GRKTEDPEGHRDRPADHPRRQPFLRRQAGAADGDGDRLSRHAAGQRALTYSDRLVARTERSEIRGSSPSCRFPDFAALHSSENLEGGSGDLSATARRAKAEAATRRYAGASFKVTIPIITNAIPAIFTGFNVSPKSKTPIASVPIAPIPVQTV